MDPEQAPLLAGAEGGSAGGRGRLGVALAGFGFCVVAALVSSSGRPRYSARQSVAIKADSEVPQFAKGLVHGLQTSFNAGDWDATAKYWSRNVIAYPFLQKPSLGFAVGDQLLRLIQKDMMSGAQVVLDLKRAHLDGDTLYTALIVAGVLAPFKNVVLQWKKSGDQWQVTQDFVTWAQATPSNWAPSVVGVPSFLAERYGEGSRLWGVISWESFAERFFDQHVVTYMRRPGEDIGNFLRGWDMAASTLAEYAHLPGCAKGQVDWQVLNYYVESPTKVHVLGHNANMPALPPFYHQWQNKNGSWKIVEAISAVGV